jgi:hypothetical protein
LVEPADIQEEEEYIIIILIIKDFFFHHYYLLLLFQPHQADQATCIQDSMELVCLTLGTTVG